MVEEQQKKENNAVSENPSIHDMAWMAQERALIHPFQKSIAVVFTIFFQWSVLLVQTTYMKEIQFGIRKKILETNNSSGI